MRKITALLLVLLACVTPAQAADTAKAFDWVGAGVERGRDLEDRLEIRGLYTVTVRHLDGTADTYVQHNAVMLEGKRYLLDAALYNSTGGYTEKTTWYVALTANDITPATPAVDKYDTFFDGVANDGTGAAQNATEFTSYTEGETGAHGSTRPQWKGITDATAASVTNSADRATFEITGSGTLYGAALVSNSAFNDDAATDWMVSYSKFTSPIAVVNTDTVNVTITITLN